MTYKFPRKPSASPYYDAGTSHNTGQAETTISITTMGLQTDVILSGDVDTTFKMPGVADLFSYNPWMLTDPVFLATNQALFRLVVKVEGEHTVTLASSDDESFFVSSEGPMLRGSMAVFAIELFKREGVPALDAFESFRVVGAAP